MSRIIDSEDDPAPALEPRSHAEDPHGARNRSAAPFAAMLQATTVATCLQAFMKALSSYGVDTLAAGDIDVNDRTQMVFYAIAWPEDWRKFYLSQKFHERDPIVDALAVYERPFTWTELRGDGRLSLARNTLDLVAKHGWSEGLVAPIVKGGGRYGLVSLAARDTVFDAEARALLILACLAFYQRVRRLAPACGYPRPPAGVTERERECLQLIAQGFSDRRIAGRLGISEATARGYFEEARAKLKAQNRPQTIAKAISLGVITV